MKASNNIFMSLAKQTPENCLQITGRIILIGIILLSAIAVTACSSGSNSESRAFQSPAPPASSPINSNVAAGNLTEPRQSPAPANKNLEAPQPAPSASVNRNLAGEEPLSRTNRSEQRADKAQANINGTWQSPIGRVTVAQNGSIVTATVFYLDGSGTGAINGRLNGQALSFKWRDKSGKGFNGTGNARVSPDGRTISGTLKLSDGRSQPFTLSR
jgi:hypothetical protein